MKNIIIASFLLIGALIAATDAQDTPKPSDLPTRTYSSEIKTNLYVLMPERNTNSEAGWLPPMVDGHRDRALAATRYKFHFKEVITSNLVETTVLNGEASAVPIKVTPLATNYYEYHLELVKTNEPPRER